MPVKPIWELTDRTLYQTGSGGEGVRKYNLDIFGISEARWTGTGKIQLASVHTLLYSGRTDNQQAEGVAIIYRSKLEKKHFSNGNPWEQES